MIDKMAGIKLASFIIGATFVVSFGYIVIDKFLVFTPPEVVVVKTELPASTVDLFKVDYDMYGSCIVGGSELICDIVNNAGNLKECSVRLEDLDGVISEEVYIPNGKRIMTLNLLETYVSKGEYPAVLVYTVGESEIRCEYTILVNEGGR